MHIFITDVVHYSSYCLISIYKAHPFLSLVGLVEMLVFKSVLLALDLNNDTHLLVFYSF